MKQRRFGIVFLSLSLAILAACAPRVTAPAPASAPPPPPPPAPAATPAPPLAADWRDAPLSAGDWSYYVEGALRRASFGRPGEVAFTIRCEGGRGIILARSSVGVGQRLTIRTSFGERALPADGHLAEAIVSLPVSDPLLDQIAFSRGRFLVEAENAPPLIVPAWPEAARVIEDCRA